MFIDARCRDWGETPGRSEMRGGTHPGVGLAWGRVCAYKGAGLDSAALFSLLANRCQKDSSRKGPTQTVSARQHGGAHAARG
jgi:hypothetical protein